MPLDWIEPAALAFQRRQIGDDALKRQTGDASLRSGAATHDCAHTIFDFSKRARIGDVRLKLA